MIEVRPTQGVVCLVARVSEVGPVAVASTLERLEPCVRQRLEAVSVGTARQMLASRALAAACLEYARPGVELAVAQLCPSCGSRGHGAVVPVSGNVHVGWSRAGELVAAASSTRGRVGIDLEPIPKIAPTAGLRQVALSRRERASIRPSDRAGFAIAWTVKEASVKLGLLELDDFDTVDAASLRNVPGVEMNSHVLSGLGAVLSVAVLETQFVR